MIIVDKALAQRQHAENPVRVAMIGAGFMARGIALQILNYVPGMDLVAISNRSLPGAMRAYAEAGQPDVEVVESVAQLDQAISAGRYAVTEEAMLLCPVSYTHLRAHETDSY